MVQASIILENTKATYVAAISAQTIIKNTKCILADIKVNLQSILKK